MFDKYLCRIGDETDFFAGYTISEIKGQAQSVFLFPSLRIIRVLSGNADWRIGEKVYRIKKNDIIAVNNTEPRQFVNLLQSPVKCEIFAFSLSLFKYESSCLELFYNRSKEFNPVLSDIFTDTTELHGLLEILKNRFKTSNLHAPSARAVISALIVAIAAYMSDTVKQKHPEMLGKAADLKKDSVEIVADAIDYINKNISEKLHVAALANKYNVSRGYFTKIFHKYTGSTPACFLNTCRINNVIHLISTQKINVLDAAFASGFSSASGFYKTFRTVWGQTPTAYLKSLEKYRLI